MKKIISLEKKNTRVSFRSPLALTLLIGGMLALVMTQPGDLEGRTEPLLQLSPPRRPRQL